MKKIYAITLSLFLLVSTSTAQVYIDTSATGLNDGTSWANAFTDFQQGIDDAAVLGGQVWVASGTYTPSFDDPNLSFSMKDLVEIYGGFTGTETALGQRDFRANGTILSGNLNNANSYHVFNNSGISSSAILDGFTITGGRANANNPMGNPGGGGMFNTNADPIIRNCSFIDNKTDTSPTTASGGAMYNSFSEPTIINSIFDNNEARTYGGAIYGEGGPSWYKIKMYNCVFRNNVAGSRGGAVAGYVTENYLVNCTVYGNIASFSDGALGQNNNLVYFSVKNSIVWGNSSPAIPTGYAQVFNSIVQGGYAGTNVLTSDPLLADPMQGDFSFGHCSPAVNAGDNSSLVAEITSDFDGNVRTIDGTVDMGAFEYQNTGISPLSMTATGNNISCYGQNNGVINLTYSGGVAPLEVFLDNNSYGTTTSITGLSAAIYEVKIVDAEGCEEIDYITITEPAELFVTTQYQDIVCNGDGDGSITINATGGTPPLQYSIDEINFGSSGNFTNLSSGNYTITVKEANNCTYTEQITISEPAVFSSGIQVQNISCNGDANGIVSFSPTGGTSPYVYSKDGVNFGGGSTFSLLSAGDYTFTILDAVSCQYSVDFTIVDPDVLSSSVQATPAACKGQGNGALTVTPVGGTGPYTYSIDGLNYQSTSVTLSQLPPNTYPLTLVDANGCTANSSVTITEPDVLSFTYQASDVLCNGDASGEITVTAAGGTPPFEYSTDGINFQSSNALSGLAAGDHDVIIRDDRGCEAFASPKVTVSEPATLSSTAQSTDIITCSGDTNGIITVTTSGGTAPYEYSADGTSFQSSDSLTGLAAGDYTVTIRDANGCLTTTSETIAEPVALALSASFDGAGVVLTATGGTGSYSYSLDGSTFQTSNSFILGNGQYTFTVKDSNDCETTTTETLLITALGDSDFKQISIYPNPARNEIYLDDLKSIREIRIIDQSGRTVFRELVKGENIRLELKGLDVGVYTILALDKSGSVMRFKLLKN